MGITVAGALPIGPIQKRDNYICQYCGKDGLACSDNWHDSTIDHVIPRKYGGSDVPENLVTACGLCNALKGQRPFGSFEEAKAYVLKAREEFKATFERVAKAVRT